MSTIKEEFLPDVISLRPVLFDNATCFCTYRLNIAYRLDNPNEKLHIIFDKYENHFNYFKGVVPKLWAVGKTDFSQAVSFVNNRSYFKITVTLRVKISSAKDNKVLSALNRIDTFIGV